MAILGVAYNLFVLGPTSLLGSAVFILFYPAMVSSCGDHLTTGPCRELMVCCRLSPDVQMFSSRVTAYFRRRGVAITDRRVQKMNEILSSIKFIKMYAWVKAFAQDVSSRCSPRTRPHLLTCSR